MFKICVSCAPRDTSDIKLLSNCFTSYKAELVELRLDRFRGDLQALVKALGDHAGEKPLITTYMFDDDPSEKVLKRGFEMVSSVLEYADYIDMGNPAHSNLLKPKENGLQVIGSQHFKEPVTYEKGMSVIRSLSRHGADVVKLVFTARSFSDNLTALKICSTASGRRVVFCMGERGFLSRTLSPLYGSEWTYASFKEGYETASGQCDLSTMYSLRAMIERPTVSEKR
ncbi:MAG: type I 3-dehydroquinate dehydratase [Thermoprotei archaeon]